MQEYTKKILGSGSPRLIISNKEMEDIMTMVKSLKNSGLLLKGVSEKFKMKQKLKRRIS